MGRLTILSAEGDRVLEWDPVVERSAEEAKREFDRLVRENFAVAYTPVKDKPGQHIQIKEFDPNAEEIVIRGPLVGG